MKKSWRDSVCVWGGGGGGIGKGRETDYFIFYRAPSVSQNQNPLYQSPEMKYENVAYGRE